MTNLILIVVKQDTAFHFINSKMKKILIVIKQLIKTWNCCFNDLETQLYNIFSHHRQPLTKETLDLEI